MVNNVNGSVHTCSYRFIKGSLEVKLPTIWTDEKAEVGRVREEKRREEKRREKIREENSGGSKSRLAKAAGAEPSSHMRD